MSFAKNMGIHANKVTKSLSNKYSQKLLDSAKKYTTDKITSASKKSAKELHTNDETEEDVEVTTYKKR